MAEKSAKEAFKRYLQVKKEATQNLSKPEQKEIDRLEEQTILRRVQKRERYATDPEYQSKKRESSKLSMRKSNAKKKANPVAEPTEEEVLEDMSPQEIAKPTKIQLF